jgi:pyruvate/2-oxoglutarate dehydrogenase complex dihydrolipoamide acyltransferase (E2) component
MAVAVIMPELGESIVEGTIVRWLKQEGDSVQEDEPIVEIMTDKVNTELPAPASGVLQQILAPANATVKVGQELALIATASESAAATAEPPAAPVSAPPPVEAVGFYGGADEPAPVATPAPAVPTRSDGQTRTATGQPFISPVVSKIAREHGISHEELLTIPGTGTGGRVTRKDIEAYIAQRKTAPKPAPAPAPAPAPQPVAAPCTCNPSPHAKARKSSRWSACARSSPNISPKATRPPCMSRPSSKSMFPNWWSSASATRSRSSSNTACA